MKKSYCPELVSLFSGAGGLDLGFEMAGFKTTWANEHDKSIWGTFEDNFPKTKLDRRSIVDVDKDDIPDRCDGIIGGPPCQSWSEAGALRGINDHRGQLFFEYIRILREKQPWFFLAENVSGILFSRHRAAFDSIVEGFGDLGYNVSYYLLNANDYEVPEDRQRVIIVGYHKKTGKYFSPPKPSSQGLTLRNAIWDIRESSVPAQEKNKSNQVLDIPNHEYMTGGFSTMYMSRNRVRSWDQPSFTIQAGGRHAPIHPQAPKMELIEKNIRRFVTGKEDLYRRLSVRECARIQTFPDTYIFKYQAVADGYKMIGNAVPVNFAKHLALKIKTDLSEYFGEIAPKKTKHGEANTTKKSKMELIQ